MDQVVVDTVVISYLLKNDTRSQWYIPRLEGKVLAISFMTLAELYRWAIRRSWGEARRNQLEFALRNYVVIPFDHELCALWARIVVEGEKAGRPIAHSDAWIAASALRHDAPLITHNPKHFEHVSGLKIISALS